MLNLKFALRTLFKTPFVTIIAIVSLALGIGANAAIFSLFNQMLLRPLSVHEPDALVNLGAPGPKPGSQSCNNAGECDVVFSYPMFRDIEHQQTVFTGMGAHRTFGANLSYAGTTLSGEGVLVSGSYFPTLGIQPTLGRLLGPDDERVVGESEVVVLSHAYWQTRFGADPKVLNQTMIVNGHTMTVVGVAPLGFDGTTIGSKPQIFVPITMRAAMEPGFTGFEDRRSYWVYLFARRKPGVSLAQAATALNVPYHALLNDVEAPLQKGMSDQTMARFRARTVSLEEGRRGQSSISDHAKAPLLLLLGVTGFVLLIACANIANLLLARAASRAGEMALRLAIGANRVHLLVQLLGESCLLAAFGGLAGLLVARWTLAVIGALLPAEMASMFHLELDLPALLFSGVLALGTGLLFGLFPALHSTRPDLVSALKGQAGQPAGARSAARFRTSLATAQIAISMALLVSAGLFARSLANVSRVDLGLRADNLVTFAVSPQLNGYTPQRSLELFVRMEDELGGLPGVTGVTTAMVPLLSGDNWGSSVSVEGFEAGPDTDTNARYNEVGAGYFRTLGVRLISGREFTPSDAAGTAKVAVVNEAFAKKFNLGRDAVGKHMSNGRGNEAKLDIEIVGLVQDSKYSDVKQEVPPLFFRPYRQNDSLGFLTFYVSTSLPPADFLSSVPKLMARLDPNLPVESLKTMREQVRENVFMDRFITVLSLAFACLATLLASVGLYGVLAYTVSQRTGEIGLRMALGAPPARVRGMVLRQVGIMTLAGGAIGLVAAVWLGHLGQSLLYQLQGHDPLVLVGASLVLAAVSLVAGFIPAYRASQVDPMLALRYE